MKFGESSEWIAYYWVLSHIIYILPINYFKALNSTGMEQKQQAIKREQQFQTHLSQTIF